MESKVDVLKRKARNVQEAGNDTEGQKILVLRLLEYVAQQEDWVKALGLEVFQDESFRESPEAPKIKRFPLEITTGGELDWEATSKAQGLDLACKPLLTTKLREAEILEVRENLPWSPVFRLVAFVQSGSSGQRCSDNLGQEGCSFYGQMTRSWREWVGVFSKQKKEFTPARLDQSLAVLIDNVLDLEGQRHVYQPGKDQGFVKPGEARAETTMKKTVVELDLVGYSDIARELEEQFSAEIVLKFNEQIQGLIDAGLKTVGINREQAVMATTGDGDILVFDQAEAAHRFAEAVHDACRVHNHARTVPKARRWFRIGVATGDLALEVSGTTRKIAGNVISRAKRLEAAGNIGEIVADAETFAALPKNLQARYGSQELIPGKREEKFPAHRCVVVPGLTPGSPAEANPPAAVAGKAGSAFKRWQDKLEYFQEQLAIVSSPALKFELERQIEEAKDKILELGG